MMTRDVFVQIYVLIFVPLIYVPRNCTNQTERMESMPSVFVCGIDSHCTQRFAHAFRSKQTWIALVPLTCSVSATRRVLLVLTLNKSLHGSSGQEVTRCTRVESELVHFVAHRMSSVELLRRVSSR